METHLALPALLSDFPPSSSKLFAVEGPHATVHPHVIRSMALQSARGESIAAIIGDNRFDLYALARLAKALGLPPDQVLTRIELSRAFTCHQFHRRACTLLPSRVQKWRGLYVLGLLDTFCDEEVRYAEAARLLAETLRHLKRLAAAGLPVLITLSQPSVPGRAGLIAIVQESVDVYRVLAPDDPSPLQVPQLTLPSVACLDRQQE